MVHRHPHRSGFSLEVRLESSHVGRLAFRVWMHQCARQPTNGLERQSLLSVEVGAAAFAAAHQLSVASFCHSEPPLGPRSLLLYFRRSPPDLVIRALEELRQRQLYV